MGFAAACGGQSPPSEPVIHDFLSAAPGLHLQVGAALEFTQEDRSRVLTAGWSWPETAGDRTFAWAIGNAATIVLPAFVDDREWLHFRCRPVTAGTGTRQTVRVRLNGVPLGVIELRPGFRDYRYRLPAGALAVDENRLDFEFSHSFRPAEAGGGDTRDLAVAFDSLRFSSTPEPPSTEARPPAAHRVVDGRLVQPAGSELAFPVTIPPRATLELGVAGAATAGPSPDGRVVWRRPGSRDRVLVEVKGPAAGRRLRVDLATLAGESAEIVFQVLGDPTDGSLSWEHPRLRGAPEMDLTSNVVLIVVDTLRADLLSVYGGEVATPHLEALAASGVLFQRAYAHAPMTAPSHASLFTSLLPTEHGVLTNTRVLSDHHRTLAEIFRHAYRRTAAFVSLGVLTRRSGIAQGFDVFHDRFGHDWWKPAAEVNREALPWLRQQGAEPFFLWVHYSDPHEPYSPPGTKAAAIAAVVDGDRLGLLEADASTQSLSLTLRPGRLELTLVPLAEHQPRQLKLWRVRATSPEVDVSCGESCSPRTWPDGRSLYEVELPASLVLRNRSRQPLTTELIMRPQAALPMAELRRLYRAEIEYVDGEIGRLLAALEATGRLTDTLIIMTSDHGESLGDHGLGGHVEQLYDTLLRVPLILSWPGRLAAGEVVEEPVSHLDLLPTLCDLLAIPDLAARAGRSLVPVLDGETDRATSPIFAETFRPEAARDLKAVVHRGYKLIHTLEEERTELYRLAADPGELADLAADRPDLARRLRALLDARMAAAEAGRTISEEGQLSAEDLEKLRALGYVR